MVIFQPMVLTGTYGKLDVSVNVQGGGGSGQAGAIRHGISKALLEYNPEFREVLKRAGFLTRDSRVRKERSTASAVRVHASSTPSVKILFFLPKIQPHGWVLLHREGSGLPRPGPSAVSFTINP